MTKKTKSKNASKGKRASEDAVRAALSILEEMSKRDKEVQVLVVGPGPFLSLAFEATVEKYEELEDCYILSTEAFDMNIAPAMSETILFSLEGGLFLSRKGIAITIELEEHSAEELLERYPGAGKLIN